MIPALREFNPCHLPGGAPAGGQFCSKDAPMAAVGSNADAWLPMKNAGSHGPGESFSDREREILQAMHAQATTQAERDHAGLIARAEAENERLHARYGADGTLGVYRRADGSWDPEREALHRKIAERILSQGGPSDHPVVIFTAGLPASGKTTAMKGLNLTGKVYINSDDIKALLPEYNGRNAAMMHAESSYLADAIFAMAVAQRRSIVYDGTMKSVGSHQGELIRTQQLKHAGYRVEARFTDVDIDTAVQRAVTRFATKPDHRYVPVGFIRAMHDKTWGSKSRATFETLKPFFDAYLVVDNRGHHDPKILQRFGSLTEAARVLAGWALARIWG